MAELSNDTKQIQLPSYPLPLPYQMESPIRPPSCPTCGSTIPNRPQRLIAAAGISENCDNGHNDSSVFSRVLLIAISRMSTITRETIEQEKMLMESKDAMVGILENVCLMKTTIKYLLNETFNDNVNNDVGNKEKIAVKKEEENEEEEDDDRGSNASFIIREDVSEEEEDNENDAYDEEKQGDRVNEGTRISRKDDSEYNNNHDDHHNGSDDGNNDDDDGECRSLPETGVEREVVTLMISQGVIGGIATMSLIAQDAPKAHNLLLADDKKALLEMLDIVRMMKLLIK